MLAFLVTVLQDKKQNTIMEAAVSRQAIGTALRKEDT